MSDATTATVQAKTKAGRKSAGEFYTTGDVSRICGVAPRTVSKWVDSGRLEGYRIPGSSNRRVTKRGLIAFMERHEMPEDMRRKVSPEVARVLLVGCEVADQAATADGSLRVVRTGFAAGLAVAESDPSAVVVDLALGRLDAGVLIEGVRKARPSAVVLVLGWEDERAWADQWSDGFICKPATSAELARRARDAAAAKAKGKASGA